MTEPSAQSVATDPLAAAQAAAASVTANLSAQTAPAAPAPTTPPPTAEPVAPVAPPVAKPVDPSIARAQQAMEKLKKAIEDGNVPDIVQESVQYALATRTSDIHIEGQENDVRIRLRVDGRLQDVIHYPKSVHPAIVARVKILANLKIDESRTPQDGRAQFNFQVDGQMAQADLRVSTLPTVKGEKIVMRIQDKSRKIPSLDQLGIEGSNGLRMNEILEAPNGVFLVSGPTGSGKTTTLYSAVQILNEVSENILTLEDPVEYEMAGLNQSQVKPDIGYTFAFGLRTALRQDPDIILLGEIRDQETIEIAIQAALTGHFVLSTIHTNSAVETVTRIQNMQVQNFLITSAIKGIMAQRLVRKVCKECKESYRPDSVVFSEVSRIIQSIHPSEKIEPEILEDVKLYRGKGCDVCNGTGYKGRLGIYEVLVMEDWLREAILRGKTTIEMNKDAVQNGMLTLRQDGTLKALRGDTSIEEVFSTANEN